MIIQKLGWRFTDSASNANKLVSPVGIEPDIIHLKGGWIKTIIRRGVLLKIGGQVWNLTT